MTEVPTGGAPGDARAWWNALGDGDRDRLLAERPADVGGLDGLPSAVRDRANRAVLAAHIARTGDPGARALLTEIGGPDTDPRDRALLLLFRPPSAPDATDGQLAVAFGDPDRAANVNVLVPGTGNNTRDQRYLVPGMDISRRMRRRADTVTGAPGSTATVYWLGYKTPDRIVPDALGEELARRGHPALTRFLHGLRAARADGPPAWQTVYARSYGAVLLGHALSATPGFPADAVLVSGAPGMGRHVQSVRDLHIDPDRFFAAGSPIDPIVYTPAAVHGANPAAPSFGGRRVDSGRIGHHAYAREDAASYISAVYLVCNLLDRVAAPAERGIGRPARLGEWWGAAAGRPVRADRDAAADGRGHGRGSPRPERRSRH
ncbi:alpha/beta hydrolase [Nocardiopsis trehalosi]|uniref:alpha/beta hydrolase n=1 Tax=Nocardiopsis trehalosi TaxID=109329 RepID=UPI00082C05C3|nr:alpha/beta hydrolase [Nocardiopsis trehalosi]